MSNQLIDKLLEAVAVHAPGMWDNDQGPHDWWAVSTDGYGILAYFARESDAFRFRLSLINGLLNPVEAED